MIHHGLIRDSHTEPTILRGNKVKPTIVSRFFRQQIEGVLWVFLDPFKNSVDPRVFPERDIAHTVDEDRARGPGHRSVKVLFFPVGFEALTEALRRRPGVAIGTVILTAPHRIPGILSPIDFGLIHLSISAIARRIG